MPHQIPLAKNTSTNKFQELKVDANGKLQVSDSVVNLNTDNLESQLPSALTGSGNLKVCIQELGNEGSERLNTDAIVDGMRGGLPTALTGDGNLKVSIQEDHTHNLALASHQTSILGAVDGLEGLIGTTNTNLATIDGSINTIEACVNSDKVDVNISSGNITGFATSTLQSNMDTKLLAIKNAVELLDNCITSGNELQVDIVASALPSGGATSANQSTMVSRLDDIKTAVELLDNCITSGNELQVDIVASALPSGASTLAKQDEVITQLTSIKTAVELLDNCITSGNELQVDIVASALPSGGATSALQGDHNTKLDHLSDNLDHLSDNLDTIDGVLDNILVKNGEIETTCDAVLAKNTEIETTCNAILAKNTEIDTAVDAMSAKLPASLGQKANASSLSVCRSTTAGAFDLSARTTIGTASTSTKLLCDAAGHLQVDVLSGASGDPSVPAEIFSNTDNLAIGATFNSSEITLTSGKPVGVLLSTGNFNTSNNIRVLVGTGSDADFALTGSSGSQVQLQTAQIDGAGTYHIAQYLDIPFPKMRLTLVNGSGNELTDFICKVFQ